MTGADLVVAHLQRAGVERVFTLSGNGLNPFYAACVEADLDLVDVHNEQAAAYMAEVEGRLTRRVGVCAVSSGVAHMNAMTGVVNAYFDGSPMLLITGSSEESTYGLGHFQELDQVALAGPVCKLARRVRNPNLAGRAVDEICAAATSARPGPVHLTIPVDVFEAEVETCSVPTGQRRLSTSTPAAGDPAQVAEAATFIDQATRPLIVAGSGVYYAKGEASLMAYARAACIPVMIPIWDRGCVSRPYDEFVGLLGPASGQPPLLADADLVILAGARVDYRVGYLKPPAVREDMSLIRISADPLELGQGRLADVAVPGDPASVFGQLLDSVGNSHASWCQEAQECARAFRERWLKAPVQSDSRMTGRGLVEALRPFVTDETLLLIDGGDIGQWAHMLLPDRYPGHWLTCGASGTVGWGVPGAIAAKLRYRDRPVILLSGDGAAGFTISELEVAVRNKAPFVMVIASDECWGVVAAGQMRKYGRRIATGFGPIRFDLVAEGFGARGVRADDPQAVVRSLREALSCDSPTVIQVPLTPCSPTTL